MKPLLPSHFVVLALVSALSSAALAQSVVYLEDFNEGSGTRTLADLGLSGVDASGTSITSSTGFNNGAVYSSSSLEGDSYASLSNDWVWMAAPQLSSVTQVRWLDTTAALDYRIGFEIGGVWYLSEALSTSTGGGFSMDTTGNDGNPVPNGDPGAVDGPFPGITITDFSSGFAAWSGAPANDTTAWDNTFTGTLGTPGALPAGTITRIGLMAESGSHRVDYFEVSGTALSDTDPPVIAGLNPGNEDTGVAIGANLFVTFDEIVKKGTSGDIRIIEVGGGTFSTIDVTSGDVTASGALVTINPPTDLVAGVQYFVEIDNGTIEDEAGNLFGGISGDGTWKFTTDATAPLLVPASLVPANGGLDVVAPAVLTAGFDEDVQLGATGDIRVIAVGGGTVTIAVDSGDVSSSGSGVTIVLPATLDYATHYYVEIDAGAIEDLSGNAFAGISGSGTWNFTTGAAPVYLEDFEGAGAGTRTIGEFGWTAVQPNGTSRTNAARVYAAGSVESVHYTLYTDDFLVSAAPALASIDEVRWLDQNAGESYRLALEVGGTWYLSEVLTTSTGGGFDPGDGAHPGITLSDFSTGFAPWGAGDATTGAPANDAEPWDLTTLGAPDALPSGTITRIGMISGGRMDYFGVFGTAASGGGNDFSDWIGGFSGLGGLTGVDDDADGDGIDNGVENFFGTPPNAFSQGLVASAVDTVANTFTFTHPLNATPADDLTATYRWSTDLATFHDGGAANGAGTTTVSFSQAAPSGGMVSVTATITGTIVPERLFVAVEVSPN